MPIFPKPPGAVPDDASDKAKVLEWFDEVEALELKPPASHAIINRLVQDKVIAKGAFGKELDIPTENQLFDEIASAGINILHPPLASFSVTSCEFERNSFFEVLFLKSSQDPFCRSVGWHGWQQLWYLAEG